MDKNHPSYPYLHLLNLLSAWANIARAGPRSRRRTNRILRAALQSFSRCWP